jgi:hypothetical protein
MKANTTVTPKIGCYMVCTAGPWGLRTHHVTKDKRCTCGGTTKRPCSHIRAVANYLRAGGSRAPAMAEPRPKFQVREGRDDNTPPAAPATCPICGVPVEKRGPDLWRCPQDSTHYWQWRGERNGGAIRKFLTGSHPTKQGAFYEQTTEEREAFLIQAARQMHTGGYTPFA